MPCTTRLSLASDWEKQQRLNWEWKTLSRGRKTALEFMPVLESLVSVMELAGMGKTDREFLLGYLGLIPPYLGLIPSNHRPDVLKDRRAYPMADGRSLEEWKRGGRPIENL